MASQEAPAEPKRVCPVGYGKRSSDNSTSAASGRNEPADTADRPLGDISKAHVQEVKSDDPGDVVPPTVIPATGRGNSNDGKTWVQPTPNQLDRATRRRDKAIDSEDAFAVAAVHDMVAKATWEAILEYEQLHESKCKAPKLARFEGKDGIYSLKAKMLNFIGIDLPFDRHDWTVDRCGTEVKYVIDYYAIEQGDDIAYSIDARPTGVGGAIDRARLACRKVFSGQSPW
eukprot:m.11585 g.11585  ORF g.11585 m.11585 type:complete len:229 (+) comp4052_c0_seq1:266-952(+)